MRDQKYQKSFKRIFHPLKNLLPRARVSRASHAWQVRAAKDRAKAVGFTAPRNLILPRVRTYHTRKPSRFVHALSARPLDNGWRGRGCSPCADGTIKINLISLCSHTDAHPNLNREVRHSLTWHSSESESALERFEPVVVVSAIAGRSGKCVRTGRREATEGVQKRNTFLFLSFSFFSDKRKEL